MPGHHAESVRLQAAAGATGNGEALNVAGYSRLGIEISGTFVATVTFEAIITTTWTAIAVNPVGGGAAVTTASAPGIFTVAVSGLAQFRARISAFTSGTVTADALATVAAS